MTNPEAVEWFTKEFPDYVFEYPSDKQMAYNLAITAIKKRIPKKPDESYAMWQCPDCHRSLTEKQCIKKMYAFCPRCGCAIDWEIKKS